MRRVCRALFGGALMLTGAHAAQTPPAAQSSAAAQELRLLERFGADPRFRRSVPELGLSFALPPSVPSEDGGGRGWTRLPDDAIEAALRAVPVTLWPLDVAKRPRAAYGLFAVQTSPRLLACLLIYGGDTQVTASQLRTLTDTIMHAFPLSTVAFDPALNETRGWYRFGDDPATSEHSEYLQVMPGGQGTIVLLGAAAPAVQVPFAEIFATARVEPSALAARANWPWPIIMALILAALAAAGGVLVALRRRRARR